MSKSKSSDGTTCQPGKRSNWSENLDYTPSCYYQPRSVADLRAIVRRAAAEGKRIRARGSGHSWNDGIATPDYSVDTSQMNSGVDSGDVITWDTITENGRSYHLVTVPPGMTQGELARLAEEKGCPLPTQGPAPDITIAGFVANGCHGTGWNEPTIDELVYGLDIMVADGSVLHFDQRTIPPPLRDLGLTPPQLMQVVRVSLGSLGIITRLTFKLPADAFHVRILTRSVPMSEVLDQEDPDKLRQLVCANDYVEVFWFPYSTLKFRPFSSPRIVPNAPRQNRVLVLAFQRTADPLTPGDGARIGLSDLMNELAPLGKYIGELLNRDIWLAPLVSAFSLRQWEAKFALVHNLVVKPTAAFLYQTKYFRDFYDISFGIPMSGERGWRDAVCAWYQLVDRMEAWRRRADGFPYPVSLTVHARFVKNSQSVLSPAYEPPGSDTHTCFLEYLSFGAGALKEHYGAFTRDFFSDANGGGWKRFNGFPHWGKYFEAVPGIVGYVRDVLSTTATPEAESRLGRFLSVRERMDPDKTFTNDFMAQILDGAPALRTEEAMLALPANGSTARTSPSLPQRTYTVNPKRFEEVAREGSAGAALKAGGTALVHDSESSTAYVLDEQGRPALLGYQHDEGAESVAYSLLAPSPDARPGEVFDRIGSALRQSGAEKEDANGE